MKKKKECKFSIGGHKCKGDIILETENLYTIVVTTGLFEGCQIERKKEGVEIIEE